MEMEGSETGGLQGCLAKIEGHSHDITELNWYFKQSEDADGRSRREVWILSASVDGTLRRWKWDELLQKPRGGKSEVVQEKEKADVATLENDKDERGMTEEEERELEELMEGLGE